MTAASYTTNLTDISTGESTTGWAESGTPGWNSGGSPAQESDYFIQGSYCISATLKSGVGTLLYTTTAQTFSTGYVLMAWMYGQCPNALGTYAQGGMRLVMGSSTTAFYAWAVSGSDKYIYGGWICVPVDPTVTADYTLGTPTGSWLTFGSCHYITGNVSKGNPHGVDALRFGRADIVVEYGDSSAGYATFAGMAAKNDANDATNGYNRWGLFQEITGGYLWQGLMTLGTTTNAVDFRDYTGANISIPNQYKVSSGFNKIEINNSNSRIDWTAVTILSNCTLSPGLFEIVNDCDVNFDNCSFINMSTFTLKASAELISTTWRNCGTIYVNGANISGSEVSNFEGTADDPAIDWSLTTDPDGNLDNLYITKGTAATHAIEFSTTDTSNKTYTLSDCTFVGYNASNSQNDSTFNFLQTSGTVTVNLNNCTGNLTYKSAGATISIASSVPITISGVTEGTAIKVVANETVGSITIGDTILYGFANSDGQVLTSSFTYEGAFGTGLSVIIRARNQGIACAAIADDGGVYTDETEEASSNTSADMTLLPTSPAVNDAYYFGHTEQFNKLKINISTALTYSVQPTITWEYYNGSWVSLSDVIDESSGFENSGFCIISYTMPSDWTTVSVNSQGPYYYIRSRLSTAGTITQAPIGASVQLDVTRYLPYNAERTITSSGLSDIATWTRDTISQIT